MKEDISIFDWGNDKACHTFIFLKDILEVSFPVSFIGANQIYFRCGDAECLQTENLFSFMRPAFIFNTYNKFLKFNLGISIDNGYIYSHSKNKDKTPDVKLQDLLNRGRRIKMTETDVILGCDEKLKRTLTELAKKRDTNIVFECSCMNKIIGSDVSSIIKNVERKYKRKILYDHNAPGALLKDFIQKYADLFEVCRQPCGKNLKNINIVGFIIDKSMQEVVSVLNLFKIKVNLTVLPRIKLDELDNFYNANLSILCPNEQYGALYQKIKMDKMFLPAPYGFNNTLRWIKEVVGFFGLHLKNNTNWKKYIKTKHKKWTELRHRAERFKIGFFIGEGAVPVLTSEKKILDGIDILGLLEEMGFKIEIIIDTSKKEFATIKKALKSRLSGGAHRHSFRLYDASVPLEELIENSDCRCFYSDIFYDTKITHSGKNYFSFFIFEKGFDGAIRSLERLLNLCETDFFRAYRNHNGTSYKPIDLDSQSKRSIFSTQLGVNYKSHE